MSWSLTHYEVLIFLKVTATGNGRDLCAHFRSVLTNSPEFTGRLQCVMFAVTESHFNVILCKITGVF